MRKLGVLAVAGTLLAGPAMAQSFAGFNPGFSLPANVPSLSVSVTVTSINGVPPTSSASVHLPGTFVSATAHSTPGGFASASAYTTSSGYSAP